MKTQFPLHRTGRLLLPLILIGLAFALTGARWTNVTALEKMASG